MSRSCFAFVLTALLASVVCSCAQEDRVGGRRIVRLWHSYRGQEKAALDKVVARFNKDNDHIFLKTLAVPHDSFANKLVTAIPHGHGPDLFIFAHERVGQWIRQKLVAPLDGALDEALFRRFMPKLVDAFAVSSDDGKRRIYGVPLAFKSVALIYNTELVSRPPRTTDEMVQMAAELTKGETYGLLYNAADFFAHSAWFYGFGGAIPEQGPITLSGESTVQSFSFVRQLIYGSTAIMPRGIEPAAITTLFNEGKVAMVINGPWFLGEINRERVKFAVAPLPVVSRTGRLAEPFLTIEGLYLSAESHHRAEALEVMAHLTSDEMAVGRAVQGRQLVANLKAYDDPQLRDDAVLANFKRQARSAVPTPSRREMSFVWEPMNDSLRKLVRGEDPTHCAEHAQVFLQKLLAQKVEEKPAGAYGLAALLLLAAGLVVLTVILARRGVFGDMRRSAHAYLYLAPAAVGTILLIFVPFILGALVAFYVHVDNEYRFVGFDNFIRILLSSDWPIDNPRNFYFTLGVTVLWTVINVFLHVVIGLGLALLLRDQWLRLRGVYRVLLIVPWAVPNYITALIWRGMFDETMGAINGILQLFGVQKVSWFGSFFTSFSANLVTNTWLGFPFMMVVCLGALQAIPRDLEEAAAVDGAGWWTRFRHVTLPLLKPALLPAVIVGSVWTFNMFNIIYLVSRGDPDGSTEILISEAYKWAFEREYRYGYAAAYAIIIFIVLLLFSKLQRRVVGQAESSA